MSEVLCLRVKYLLLLLSISNFKPHYVYIISKIKQESIVRKREIQEVKTNYVNKSYECFINSVQKEVLVFKLPILYL